MEDSTRFSNCADDRSGFPDDVQNNLGSSHFGQFFNSLGTSVRGKFEIDFWIHVRGLGKRRSDVSDFGKLAVIFATARA